MSAFVICIGHRSRPASLILGKVYRMRRMQRQQRTTCCESIIEQAAFAWLERVGWTVKHGPDIAPGELAAERADDGQVVLTPPLQDALPRLNPVLPAEALDEAFRKLTRPEGPTLEARNRPVHRLLVDGMTAAMRRGSAAAVSRARHPRAAHGQPHDRRPHRPQRPGRPALRQLLALPGPLASAPSAG